jgi:hypothetical protein
MVMTISTISTHPGRQVFGQIDNGPGDQLAAAGLLQRACDRDQTGQQHDHLPFDQRVEIASADDAEQQIGDNAEPERDRQRGNPGHRKRDRGGEDADGKPRLGALHHLKPAVFQRQNPEPDGWRRRCSPGPISSSTSPALIGR